MPLIYIFHIVKTIFESEDFQSWSNVLDGGSQVIDLYCLALPTHKIFD